MDREAWCAAIHGVAESDMTEWLNWTMRRQIICPKDYPGIQLIRDQQHIFFKVSVQFSSVAQSCPTLRPHESQHTRPPCPSPTTGLHPDSCPSSRWCHPTISSSVVPFSSYPQSLPASESSPMSQLFAWGGQSTGVSALASFLPKKSLGWYPLKWTSWISLQSKGLSTIFSNTTVQKHQFFSAQFSSQSNSHIHTRPLEKPQPWLDRPLLAK